MSTSRVGIDNPKMDKVLWAAVFAVLASAIAGNIIFASQSLLLRVVGGVVLAAIAIAIALRTNKGKQTWILWQESVQEVRKIYWPTRQETVQTTLAVLAMVLVMGILLWTTDFLLIRGIGWLTGHWGV